MHKYTLQYVRLPPLMMNCATRGAALAAAGACPAERPAAPLRQVPGEGLERTEVSINAPGTHHVVADRLDVTKRSAGVNRFEWGAPESKLGMDIAVHALEGSGARSAPRAHERLAPLAARWPCAYANDREPSNAAL